MIKKIIKSFDQAFLGGALYRCHEANKLKTLRSAAHQTSPFHFEIFYAKNSASLLSSLCDTYGSDKGEIKNTGHPYSWPSHSYADYYEMLFEQKRDAIKLVVECGLGTNNPDLKSSMGISGKPGASLRVWRDYFPHARIIGVDIDKDILFTENRIETFFVDQTAPETIKAFQKAANLGAAQVDIVIDDGLHEFHAGRCLFENLIDALAPDGVYIIEDVTQPDVRAYGQYFSGLTDNYYMHIVNLHRPGLPLNDNSLIVIRKKARR